MKKKTNFLKIQNNLTKNLMHIKLWQPRRTFQAWLDQPVKGTDLQSQPPPQPLLLVYQVQFNEVVIYLQYCNKKARYWVKNTKTETLVNILMLIQHGCAIYIPATSLKRFRNLYIFPSFYAFSLASFCKN